LAQANGQFRRNSPRAYCNRLGRASRQVHFAFDNLSSAA
jgi:hypothetical protein